MLNAEEGECVADDTWKYSICDHIAISAWRCWTIETNEWLFIWINFFIAIHAVASWIDGFKKKLISAINSSPPSPTHKHTHERLIALADFYR